MFDPHRLDLEVTNNSNLPLKITDAKLLFMKDWKREKDILILERSKQLMERIQNKMK